MDCNNNIKEYEAIIQQMVDLDRQKIIYPITTDNAVILTSLKESPISLTDYLGKIKQYYEMDILQLYERLHGETPEGKAYRAIDGLKLENDVSLINSSIVSLQNILESLQGQQTNNEFLQNQINVLKESIQLLNNTISNLEYEYELLLFKVTDDVSYVGDSLVYPEQPIIDSNGNILNNWDINYSDTNKYVWMASTIVKIKGTTKTYQPWKVSLLYDKKGNYVENYGKYEKKIYFRTKKYEVSLDTPGDNWISTGWTSEPQGVDPEYSYEYVSSRWFTLEDSPLGTWSKPVLWSRWGISGVDSANIEYIYCALEVELDPGTWISESGTNPQEWTNDPDFQTSEYIRPTQRGLWYDNPVGLKPEKPYQYVSIRKKIYKKVTDTYEWQSYSKPSLWSSLGKDGQDGDVEESQGLMGPVVRFKGIYSPEKHYYNMKNDLTLGVNDIRYVDVVKYQEDFYMVLPKEGQTRDVIGITPSQNSNDWTLAEDFEFIATDVLYAGQGKVDYLSSNEVVIFDKDTDSGDSHIVAGMTGGNSTLVSDSHNYGEGNDPVRIWAGSNAQYNEGQVTSIDLQESPFRVYQNGKLIAENAEITGNISAKSISLTGNNVFWYNQNTIELPTFEQNQHMLAYILLYDNGENCVVKTPNQNTKILYYKVDTVNNEKYFEKVSQLTIEDNNLYTLISNYDSVTEEYQWVITQQGVYYTNIQISDVGLDRQFEIIKGNPETNSGENENKVKVYFTNARFESSEQGIPTVTIEFKFKLGNEVPGVDNNSFLTKADLRELIMRLELPNSDSRGNRISYKLNSNSAPYIVGFSNDSVTIDNLTFSHKEGNYINITKNLSNPYELVLNVLDENGDSIVGTNLYFSNIYNDITLDYRENNPDNNTIKLLRK